jgi:hypothetical protein
MPITQEEITTITEQLREELRHELAQEFRVHLEEELTALYDHKFDWWLNLTEDERMDIEGFLNALKDFSATGRVAKLLAKILAILAGIFGPIFAAWIFFRSGGGQ